MSSSSTDPAAEVLDKEDSTFSVYNWKSLFEVDPNKVELAKSIRDDPNETGLDRIKQIWTSYHAGEKTMEGRIIVNSICMGGFSGLVLGGIYDTRSTMQDFVRQHNTNVYTGKFRANRELADKMYIEFARRGFRQGLKYGLFSGLFVGMLTLSTTYRNDVFFVDCALSGALTGSVWRAHLGPRAIMVNAVVGSIFGLTFAAIMKLSMKLSNTNIREMRFYHKAIKDDSVPVPK